MRKSFFSLLAMLSVLGAVGMANAVPMYYTYEGSIGNISTSPGGSTTLITNQGINIGDWFTFVILIDFDRSGERTLNSGGNYPPPPDSFYADFILSVPRFEAVNRGYDDPQPIAEFNYGTVTALDGGWRSNIYVGPGDARVHLSHYPVLPIPIYEWEEGQLCGVTFTVFDHLTGSCAAAYTNGRIVTISETNPIPEPTTMLLLASGLIGLFAGFRRKFKSS